MFQVTADIRFLDGLLAGLLIVDGFRVSFPTAVSAQATAAWLTDKMAAAAPIRACGLKDHFEVVGSIKVLPVKKEG